MNKQLHKISNCSFRLVLCHQYKQFKTAEVHMLMGLCVIKYICPFVYIITCKKKKKN